MTVTLTSSKESEFFSKCFSRPISSNDAGCRFSPEGSSVQQPQREGAVRTDLSPDRDFCILQTTEKLQRRTIIYTALTLKPVPSYVPSSPCLSIFSGFMALSSNTPVKLPNFNSHTYLKQQGPTANCPVGFGECLRYFTIFLSTWTRFHWTSLSPSSPAETSQSCGFSC